MPKDLILIVDDNETNLKLIKLILSLEHYQVKTASDANEAINVLNNCRPNLILMDIQLPGMDGLELTRRIKADPNLKGTLIIAVTAYAMQGDEAKALKAGCDGYITKPIDTKTLPKQIEQFLEKKAEKEPVF